MRRAGFVLLMAALPANAANAQTMPVATFLAKADALQKKGPLALFSSDIGRLKAEIQKSGKALRAEQEAARKAGRTPAACLPKQAEVNSNELLAHFRAIPPAQRGLPVKAAFASFMAKKYPCPPA